MRLSRYDLEDEYVLEELRREYQCAEAAGRIRLLQQLQGPRRDRQIPFEVARLAVEDASAEVRQWLARHGQLLDYRYRETPIEAMARHVLRIVSRASNDGLSMRGVEAVAQHILGGTQPAGEEAPEKNLAARLRYDPDPFVRACLHENPGWAGFPRMSSDERGRCFREANHLERLALMRNTGVSEDLVPKVFDFHETELGLTRKEREELVLGFLTNPEIPKRWGTRSREKNPEKWGYRGYTDLPLPPDSVHSSTFWELIAQWPEDAQRIKHAVFSTIQNVGEHTRTKVYAACTDPFLRRTILETCGADDPEYVQDSLKALSSLKDPLRRKILLGGLKENDTVKAALQDADDECRAMAYARARQLEGPALKEVLKGQDQAALIGLSENRHLEGDVRQQAAKRLRGTHASPSSRPPYAYRVPDYDFIREMEEEEKGPPLSAAIARVFEPHFSDSDSPPNLEEKFDVVAPHLARSVARINDRVEELKSRLDKLGVELELSWAFGLAILGGLLWLIAMAVGAFNPQNMMILGGVSGALALLAWLEHRRAWKAGDDRMIELSDAFQRFFVRLAIVAGVVALSLWFSKR